MFHSDNWSSHPVDDKNKNIPSTRAFNFFSVFLELGYFSVHDRSFALSHVKLPGRIYLDN